MKFKNVKKSISNKKKKIKSPKNSRIISDPTVFLRIYKISLKAFVAGSFILAVVIVGLDLQRNIQTMQVIDSEKNKLTEDLIFWKDFTAKHENYRDAYFKMSILEYRLGNMLQAKAYIKQGLSLDPNSENGRKIEEFLNK